MDNMLEVAIDSVRINLASNEVIILLQQKDSERYLPIRADRTVTNAIVSALVDAEPEKLSLWDVIMNSFTRLDAKVLRVEIIKAEDNTYYGNIVAGTAGNIKKIEALSSDLIAIAVRAHVAIFVSAEIMDIAGINRFDVRNLPSQKIQLHSDVSGEIDEKSLSVFRDSLYLEIF